MNIANVDRGLYPDERWLARLEQQLLRRGGTPLEVILADIAARRKQLTYQPAPSQHEQQPPETTSKPVAKMKDDAHPLPLFTQEEYDDDDFEQLRDKA